MGKELLKELESEFEKIRKEIGFKASLEELDDIFFIKDFILSEGYISNHLGRQVCSRISQTLMNWNNYLHGLVFTNPGNMMLMTEAKLFGGNQL